MCCFFASAVVELATGDGGTENGCIMAVGGPFRGDSLKCTDERALLVLTLRGCSSALVKKTFAFSSENCLLACTENASDDFICWITSQSLIVNLLSCIICI